mmetsp:Transcript_22642/g.49133  ORF Transcript_22642/g.49133 Transcript_22642/m.49133 type:complete len:115 (+) Transcript_22642:747-1091(+)
MEADIVYFTGRESGVAESYPYRFNIASGEVTRIDTDRTDIAMVSTRDSQGTFVAVATQPNGSSLFYSMQADGTTALIFEPAEQIYGVRSVALRLGSDARLYVVTAGLGELHVLE